ncbi:tetratricopeptide repeat protein [Candidatus Latescibacterota bacterium]
MLKSKNKKILIILLVVLFFAILLSVLPNFSFIELSIIYPFDETIFPPEISPPTFRWDDRESGVLNWIVRIEFDGSDESYEVQTESTEWTPKRDMWETIKEKSLEKPAKVTILGYKNFLGMKKIQSKNSITLKTSRDEVGAPIFFRSVPLPFRYALENMELIKWCLGDVSSEKTPRVVLENMLMCGNCHSFSANGKLLGMDVDYANDKGSYVISDIEEGIKLTPDKVITWSDYKKEDNKLTFGLLSQMSPDGRYSVSTVKDRSVFVPVPELYYSQLFFPLKGILVYYDRETNSYHALPGADDKRYVQSNPSWSPDGKYIVFARNNADSLKKVGSRVVLSPEQCEEYLSGEKKFPFELYRIPFNEGKGGKAVPITGASGDGKSNYFAKYSPDGKWIVFCKAESFMLLQPDSKLYIIPAEGGQPREMRCNTNEMNSWHSWSPNSKWLVFSSKVFTPYTQLFLTHIDEDGNDSPPVLLSNFTSSNMAVNIPEFLNIKPGTVIKMYENFVDYYSYCRKGEELVLLDKYEKAEYFFRKSIELNPDFALAHRNLGELLTRINRFDEAEKEWDIALKLDPNDPTTLVNLGTTFLNRKEKEKAKKAFEQSLKLDPRCASALEGLGILSLEKGDLEDARKKFETAVSIDPELADAHYRLGSIYMTNREFDKAEKAFETVLSYKNDVDAHSNLGILYMQKNDFDKAEKAFRTVYQFDPNNSSACFMLGRVLGKNNKLEEAISMYNKGLSLMPSNALGYAELGNIYMQTGQIDRAISVFEKALKLNPKAQDLKEHIEKLKRQR